MLDPRNQNRWALGVVYANLALAIGMNVLRALTRPEGVSDWTMVPYLVFLNGILPLMFMAVVHVALGEWRTGKWWVLVRFGALGFVALILFVSSYRNSLTLLEQWKTDPIEAHFYPAVFELCIIIGATFLFGRAMDEYEKTERARERQERRESRVLRQQAKSVQEQPVAPAHKTAQAAETSDWLREALSAPQTGQETALPPKPQEGSGEGGSEAPTAPRKRKPRAIHSTESLLANLQHAHNDADFRLPTSASAIRKYLQSQPIPIPCGSPRANELAKLLNAWHPGSCECRMTTELNSITPDAVVTNGGAVMRGVNHQSPSEPESDMECVTTT